MQSGLSVVSTIGCGVGESKSLSSTDERHNFNSIPVPQRLLGMAAAGNDLLVQLDRNAAGRYLQAQQQLRDRQFRLLFTRLAIEEDIHKTDFTASPLPSLAADRA
jgi:hypothetical protein